MDGTASIDVFEHAARYESELTDRQRQVLRLIAADKTNIEIADALGITLAGAKWHVSELLSKLSLESREAAAEYHRWRSAPHRRASRSVRGLFSATAFKLGLAGAGGLAAVAVGAAVLFSMNGDEADFGPAVPGLPFYMEATFTRTEAHYSYDAARRYWYQDERHQRTERDTPVVSRNDPGFEVSFGAPGTSTILRDGARQWTGGPLYRGEDLAKFVESRQAISGTALGPLKYASIEAWIDDLGATGGDSELPSSYEAKGTRRLLGRDVELFERENSGAGGAGYRRVWIDRERLFVLKTESMFVDPDGHEILETETATRLEYGNSQPSDRFVFVPDPSWVENRCERSDGQFSMFAPPAPFLQIPQAALPTGTLPRTFGNSVAPDGSCDVSRYEFATTPDATSPTVLFIRQEAHNLDSVFSTAPSQPVDVGGIEARLGEANDGGRSVAWLAGPVGVEVRSPALTDEELIAFATAMVEANR